MSIFSCSFYSVWLDYLSVSGPIPHYVNYSNFTTSSGYQQDQSLKQGRLTASISILSLPFSYRINLWILLVLLRQNYSRLPLQLDMSMWLSSGHLHVSTNYLQFLGCILKKTDFLPFPFWGLECTHGNFKCAKEDILKVIKARRMDSPTRIT